MMRNLFKLTFLAIFCVSLQVDAQNIRKKISDDRGHPKMIIFKESAQYRLDNSRQVFQEQLEITDDYQFSRTRSENDNIGYTHERYQQYYKNLKVEFGTYTLHGKNSKVRSVSGEFYKIEGLNMTPAISRAQAFQNALNHTNARNYLWEYPEAARAMDNYQKPKGELLILPVFNQDARTMEHRLAYKFDIYATYPLSRGYLYIDAHSGEALFYNAIIKHATTFGHVSEVSETAKAYNKKIEKAKKLKATVAAMVSGTAQTRYSGSQTIETTQSGSYSLNDASRSVYTRDALNQAPGNTYPYINNYTEFTDNDNNWTSGEHSADKDDAALDAHWGAMMTYDYFLSAHSRNSYNGSGAQIRSYVHVDNNYDNAFWNGSVMSYGDGSSNGSEGNGYFDALTSIDVAAHEIGHAVCTFTADLAYQRESGGMNEGFSDIWGAAVEHFAKGNGNDLNPSAEVWLIGDEIDRRNGSAALRSMSNPTSLGQPDTYGGTNWINPNCGTPTQFNDYCGVHTNSGVLNFWFYLLTTGGSDTNDIGSNYNVSGIGMTKAAAIAYRLLSTYLSANSTFANARSFGIQAAVDLYGADSAEEIAVTNAWHAVGVGTAYGGGGGDPTYCASIGNSVADEYIGRVQLNTIDNASAAPGGGYSDYTSISTDLAKNSSATITITPTWTGTLYNEGYSVWIDYNQDNDFDDAGEQVFSQAANQTTPVSGNFTVPASATDGATRMRVSMKYNGIPTSCESFSYGEVEDYTVNITAGGGLDTTAPEITLIGNASVDITEGDPYNDQGATASDDTDGNITANIVTVNNVDNNTPGVYQVTYNVSDAAGNAAIEVTRTVNVSDVVPPPDTTAPVITLIGNSPIDITEGDPYNDQGATATDDTDGNITANIVTVNNVDNTTPGVYQVTYNVSDAAGNDATEVTRTVNVNAAGGGGTDVLHQGFFESGWDGWSDGGSDCYRYTGGTRSYEGNSSIRIRDNSGTGSSMTLSNINVSGYDTVEIEFYFYSYSMENGEDFWVQYNGGSGWVTVASYARGTSFNNNAFYTATVTIDSASHNFPSNAQFRFRCDASANGDHIYIDQVTITGLSGGGAGIVAENNNTIQEVQGGYGFAGPELTDMENNREEDYMIYPNPIKDMLTIERSDTELQATYEIMDMNGKMVKSGTLDSNPINVSRLKAGVYIVKINDGEEVVHRKIIKN